MIAFLVGLAWASSALGLDDVLSSVAATHPTLGAQGAQVDAADGELLAARGGFDPALVAGARTQVGQFTTQEVGIEAPLGRVWGGQVTGGWIRGVGEFDPYEGGYKTAPSGAWEVGATLPLLRDAWTDRRRVGFNTAMQGREVAQADLEQARLDLLRAGALRWVDWVAAGRKFAIARRIEEVARERDAAYARLEQLGEASAFDRLDNQRLLIERQDRRIAAERALERAAIALSLWVRDGDGRPVVPPPDALPELFDQAASPGLEDPVTLAMERRPELRKFDARLNQVEFEARLQGNQALPAVDLSARAELPIDAGYEPEVDLGVKAKWSVPARTARGRGDVADANARRLAEERRLAVDRITAEVLDSQSAARAAAAGLQATTALVEAARAVESGERARFELGDSNLIFVNQRELATAEAEARQVDAIAATWAARVDLLWATGTLDAP